MCADNANMESRTGKPGETTSHQLRIEEDLAQKANLLELSIDSIFIHDVEGNLFYVNREACESHGYTKGEMMRLTLRDLELPEYASLDGSRMQDLLTKGEATFESAHFRKDGSILPVEVHSRFVETGGGRLIFRSARDMTEQQHAAAALKESEARYRTLVESVTDYIYTVEVSDGRAVSTRHGPGCIAVTGYSSEEYERDPNLWYTMIFEEDCAAVLRQSERVLANETVAPLEHRIIHKDGSIRWVRNTPVPRRDRTGKLTAYDGLISDITERKRLEDELLKVKKLESVGILAGGIAHDFNNLLSIILGNISFSKMQLDPMHRTVSYLTDAEKACEHAKELSYRLLTFSKGGEPLKRATSMAQLIRGVAVLSLSGSNVSCDLRLPEGLCPVDVDPGQMQQVLSNLIINAREAMPGGGTLEIGAENVTISEDEQPPLRPGQYLMISVSDRGVGIPPENLPRIFDPYFTTKELGSQKGMGLGLAICHSVVSKHGGLITVQSEAGKGTVFFIYLPASCAKPAKESPRAEERPSYKRGKGRVLLMDDEQGLREIGREMLQFLGYEATAVPDGAEAVREFRQARDTGRPYDAVILDLTVPGGTGGCDTIKEMLEVDSSVKGVVSSGYGDDPILSNYRMHGFAGAIAKPYSVQHLGDVLQRILAPAG